MAKRKGQTIALNVCYEDVVPTREIEGLEMIKDSGFECDRLYLISRDTEQDIDGIRCVPLCQWLMVLTWSHASKSQIDTPGALHHIIKGREHNLAGTIEKDVLTLLERQKQIV